jgi:hypothetical protein
LDLARIASLVIKERYGRKQKWVIIDWFFLKNQSTVTVKKDKMEGEDGGIYLRFLFHSQSQRECVCKSSLNNNTLLTSPSQNINKSGSTKVDVSS